MIKALRFTVAIYDSDGKLTHTEGSYVMRDQAEHACRRKIEEIDRRGWRMTAGVEVKEEAT